ncbi:MAG: hypothetical protein JSV22_10480 [Bacteroidales bacterium]|nr:MAG: hypothetical protein JSV22_10480 [Bacteroidales bacterium]
MTNFKPLKYILLPVFLLYPYSALPENNYKSDTGIIDDQQKFISVNDSLENKTDTLSIKESFTNILYQLQSLISEQEFIIRTYRKVIVGLLIAISFIIIILIINIKKQFYFPHFPFHRQKKGYHPGLVCLQMISRYFGRRISYKRIKKASKISGTQNVLSVKDIIDTGENIGFQIKVTKTDINQLISGLYLPVILYLPNHMVILYKITNEFVFIADPFYGFLKLKIYYFLSTWYGINKNQSGIALLVKPSGDFKGRSKRIQKTLSVDYSEIKPLEKRHWKEIICEI